MVPLDRFKTFLSYGKAEYSRIVAAGKIITAGGIASGMELNFYLLERHGYGEKFINEVARIMEYSKTRRLLKDDHYIRK